MKKTVLKMAQILIFSIGTFGLLRSREMQKTLKQSTPHINVLSMKKLSKNLSIHKATIANLTGSELANFKGGGPEGPVTSVGYERLCETMNCVLTEDNDCISTVCVSQATDCDIQECETNLPPTELC